MGAADDTLLVERRDSQGAVVSRDRLQDTASAAATLLGSEEHERHRALNR